MTHKVTIEVPPELYQQLIARIPWGNRQRVLIHVLQLLNDALQKDGEIVIGAIMADRFSLVWNPQQVDWSKKDQYPYDGNGTRDEDGTRDV